MRRKSLLCFVFVFSVALFFGCSFSFSFGGGNEQKTPAQDAPVAVVPTTQEKSSIYTSKDNEDLLNYAKSETPKIVSPLSKIENKETVQETAKEPQLTVSDYYYLLPSKYVLGGVSDSKKEREKNLKLVDDVNYYLEFAGNTDVVDSLAIFLTPEKKQIVAVSSLGCGPICEQKLYFLTYDGKWHDVTFDLLPTLKFTKQFLLDKINASLSKSGKPATDTVKLLYLLPRYGTAIKVIDQYSDLTLYELHWSKGKFYVKEVL